MENRIDPKELLETTKKVCDLASVMWRGEFVEFSMQNRNITRDMFYKLKNELEKVEKNLEVTILLSDFNIMPS